jgi:cell division protein ZapA (FtsZ GTPase activity inhibitor)
MRKVSALRIPTISSASMVLDMLANILADSKIDIYKKLDQLHELSVERTIFDSPEQVVKIISVLANIISSDPDSEVRLAALGVMEQMIALEEKAEAEQGKPVIDWRTVNVLLRAARQQTEQDTEAAALINTQQKSTAAIKQKSHICMPLQIPRPEPGLKAVKLESFVAINAHSPIMQVPMPLTDAPRPRGMKPTPVEEKYEPPIMKFLRSVADTDEEEHIRALATRIIVKIENLTSLKLLTPLPPTLIEG